MAMSGITLDDEVITTYESKMRLHSSDKKDTEKKGKKAELQCMIMKLSDDQKTIQIEKTFPQGALTFEQLKEELPVDEGRYVLFDMEYHNTAGAKNNKVVFITWNPDCGKIKLKMVLSASKDAITKKIEAIGLEVQANDLGDLSKEEIQTALKK